MKKVLTVEDDQTVAHICRNKLAVEGFHVEIAHDGHMGLEMVHSFRPDVILLDLMLPKTPVIFVTSLNDFESRASSMMSSGNEFIAKPFLFMELAVKALVHAPRGRLEPVQR